MKYIYLSLIILLTACNVFAQTANFKVVWDYNNPTENVTKYRVFLVELSDTTLSPLQAGMTTTNISQYWIGDATTQALMQNSPDSAVFNFSSTLNGKYIQAGITAVNSVGESFLAVSAFYLKEYALLPTSVRMVRIR